MPDECNQAMRDWLVEPKSVLLQPPTHQAA